MGVMEKHAAGTVCGAELSTPDAEGAKRFYRALFGWEFEDRDSGPAAAFSMARLDGRDVASIRQPDGEESGLPARWRIHIAVADADAAVRKARDLGAKLSLAPASIAGAGRFALVRDATGADVGIWQADGRIGAQVMGVPGALAWSELVTRETGTANRFFWEWLGWSSRAVEPGSYALFLKDGYPVAGMIRMSDERADPAPHWRAYFQAGDCGALAEEAVRLGAQCLLPAMLIPGVGTVAWLRDPQGGVFALLQSPAGSA